MDKSNSNFTFLPHFAKGAGIKDSKEFIEIKVANQDLNEAFNAV